MFRLTRGEVGMKDISIKEYVIMRLNEVDLTEADLHNLYMELKNNMINLDENRAVQNESVRV